MVALTLLANQALADVTFMQAGAESRTQAGINAPDTIKLGPSDRSLDVQLDPYVLSKSDSREDRGQSRVIDSSAGAVQFSGAAKAEFFVRSSVNVDAGAGEFQFPAHGAASTSAFYSFTIGTESTVSFSYAAFPSDPTAYSQASLGLSLFDLDSRTYLRLGTLAGTNVESYLVPAGKYNISLSAFSEGSIPARIAVNTAVASSAVANLSVSISAVPEPTTGVLMLLGAGLVGFGASRRRRGEQAMT